MYTPEHLLSTPLVVKINLVSPKIRSDPAHPPSTRSPDPLSRRKTGLHPAPGHQNRGRSSAPPASGRHRLPRLHTAGSERAHETSAWLPSRSSRACWTWSSAPRRWCRRKTPRYPGAGSIRQGYRRNHCPHQNRRSQSTGSFQCSCGRAEKKHRYNPGRRLFSGSPHPSPQCGGDSGSFYGPDGCRQ